MTFGIFYSTRSFLGREGKNIIRHLNIISKSCEKVDHLSNARTDSVKDHIQRYSNFQIDQSVNFFGDFYENTAVNMNSWIEIYNALDVDRMKKYDIMFIIGGIDLWRSGLTRFGKRTSLFPNDSGQIKFQSVGVHCINILAMLKAHNSFGIPLHELSFDPNEINVGLFHKDVAPKNKYYLYHGYDIPKYNMLRLDSLQHHFESRSVGMITRDKTTDFTFGYNVLEKSDREHFKKDINDLILGCKSYNLYIKDYQTNVDNTIDGDIYLDKLEESRFTFILPSYDRHCFSIYRFIEALYHDCLPLIHHLCNIVDVEKSYNIDLSPLITSVFPTETRRLELLDYVKKMMIVEKCFK